MKKPVQAIELSSSLLIDPTKEPLRTILTPYRGITHVPSELAASPGPELMVFIELNKCFQKAGHVSEGMVANIIWGFRECGYEEKHTAAGLYKLRNLGYLDYTDAAGMPIHELDFNPNKPIWVRYTKKFTDLLVKETHEGLTFEQHTTE